MTGREPSPASSSFSPPPRILARRPPDVASLSIIRVPVSRGARLDPGRHSTPTIPPPADALETERFAVARTRAGQLNLGGLRVRPRGIGVGGRAVSRKPGFCTDGSILEDVTASRRHFPRGHTINATSAPVTSSDGYQRLHEGGVFTANPLSCPAFSPILLLFHQASTSQTALCVP